VKETRHSVTLARHQGPLLGIERAARDRRHNRPDALAEDGLDGPTVPCTMTSRLRVGQPITPDQFDELTDEQLVRLVPRAYREFFPGKDFCADGCFYLHDGTAWSFFKAGFLDQ
jgi:hypothetical protein